MKNISKKVWITLTAVFNTLGVVSTVVVLVFWPFRDPLVSYVKPNTIWTASDFHEMLAHCSPERLDVLEKSLKLKDSAGTSSERVAAIKRDLVWESSNLFEYPLRDNSSVDYHKIVKWVAKKHGVSLEAIDREPTFILERLIFEQVFKDMWDKLTIAQRLELLNKIDTPGQLDAKAIAAVGGTAALAALATTTYFAGFAFYTTMSTVICSMAGFFGVTLPFVAYTGASTALAFLSGPFGWTLIAITAAGNLALLGRANLREVTEFVIQMHSLKVVVLKNSGTVMPEPATR